MANQRLNATVRGRVHMVGFRFFVQDRATELGLVGWVRNTEDGRVQVLAEGPRGRLETLLEDVRRGPPAARVEGVDYRWDEASGEFQWFRITC